MQKGYSSYMYALARGPVAKTVLKVEWHSRLVKRDATENVVS
jgi:hypothetical protein